MLEPPWIPGADTLTGELFVWRSSNWWRWRGRVNEGWRGKAVMPREPTFRAFGGGDGEGGGGEGHGAAMMVETTLLVETNGVNSCTRRVRHRKVHLQQSPVQRCYRYH